MRFALRAAMVCAGLALTQDAASVSATAQTTQAQPDLPAAPMAAAAATAGAAPARPNLTLPPGITGSHVVIAAHGDVPPPAPAEAEVCYAPAEGIYALDGKKMTAALEQEVGRYTSVMLARIDQVWTSRMPRAASDPWVRKASLTVRFAILPTGEIDTPLVTIFSGRRDYDRHAVDAIAGASPFDPLPAGMTRALALAMCMHFSYLKSSPEPKAPSWDYRPSAAGASPPAAKPSTD